MIFLKNMKIEYSKFLRHLTLSNYRVSPKPSEVLSNLSAVNLDYDLIADINELYGMGSYDVANKNFCDSLLKLNELMASFRSVHSSLAGELRGTTLTDVRELLDSMKVDKVSAGGLLSKIPLLNVLYSYDIKCFAARLKIYSEDLVECHDGVEKLIAKTESSRRTLGYIKSGLEELFCTLASYRAGYEQVLFLAYKGGLLRSWLRTELAEYALDAYNDCVDALEDTFELMTYTDELMSANEASHRLAKTMREKVFVNGISKVATVLDRTSGKVVEFGNGDGMESFVESVGNGDRVMFSLEKLREQFQELLNDITDIEAGLSDNAAVVVDIFERSKGIEYRNVMPEMGAP